MAKKGPTLEETINQINKLLQDGAISVHQSRLMTEAAKVSRSKRVNRRKPPTQEKQHA